MKNLDKYKVEKYKVENNNNFDQFAGYVEIEYRYRVIDIETGEIIDDAQGYGFKNIQGAYKCLYYKINKSEIDKLNILYKKILKKYKYLETLKNEINDNIFYSIKNGDKLTKKEINSYVLFEIEKNIPELLIELNDENFKKHFLKEITK